MLGIFAESFGIATRTDRRHHKNIPLTPDEIKARHEWRKKEEMAKLLNYELRNFR